MARMITADKAEELIQCSGRLFGRENMTTIGRQSVTRGKYAVVRKCRLLIFPAILPGTTGKKTNESYTNPGDVWDREAAE